jgi:hypothetical protein
MKKFVAVSTILLWTAHASAQDVKCEVKRDSFVNGGTSSVTMLMVPARGLFPAVSLTR